MHFPFVFQRPATDHSLNAAEVCGAGRETDRVSEIGLASIFLPRFDARVGLPVLPPFILIARSVP